MIKITCDLCGKVVVPELDYEVEIPRNITYYAMANGVKLYGFGRVELYQTHLCKACGNKLALQFPTIE